MFCIFEVFVFLSRCFNLSVDTIQRDRFDYERGFRKLSREFERKEQPKWIRKIPGGCLIGGFLRTFEYNQISICGALLFFSNLFLLSVRNMMNLVQIFNPRAARDPETGESLNSAVRFLESMYLFDTMDIIDSRGMLHRLSFLILSTMTIQKLMALHSRFKSANTNQDKYIKLNVVQLNISYYLALKSSLSGWWKIFKAGLQHKCKRCHAIRDGRAKKVAELHEKLKTFACIDRFYYFNQIDFNDCFKELEDELKIQPDERFFVARPTHRSDPLALSVFLGIWAGGFAILCLSIVANSICMCWPAIMECGFDTSRPLESYLPALRAFFGDAKHLANLVQVVIVNIVVAFNMIDLALLVHTSITQFSRSHLVNSMLELEVDFYRSYTRLFENFLKESNLAIENLEDYKSATFYQASILSRRQYQQVSGSACDARPISSGGDLVYKDYRILLAEFRFFRTDRAELDRMNENIEYLTELVHVLQREQKDVKDFSTWNLNVSILFGTFGLSMASTLLVDIKNITQMIVFFNFAFTSVVSLAISLLTGAASEYGFRKIHKRMEPLMINQLGLVSRSVVLSLQKTYSHLSAIKNRSFMLLGNIPLTFGSLTSIVGWIATCNLLLLRFLQ